MQIAYTRKLHSPIVTFAQLQYCKLLKEDMYAYALDQLEDKVSGHTLISFCICLKSILQRCTLPFDHFPIAMENFKNKKKKRLNVLYLNIFVII